MMSEVMVDVLGPDRPLAYLSGPSFAMEIAQERTNEQTNIG